MKKKDTYIYPAKFIYEDGKEIAVVFPDFELATSGTDEADALKSAKEALGGRLWLMEMDGDEIPDPTPLPKVITSANEIAVLIEVFMPSVRMAENSRSVNRTVTLPAWLNAKALEKGINFSQLLQEAIKSNLNINESELVRKS